MPFLVCTGAHTVPPTRLFPLPPCCRWQKMEQDAYALAGSAATETLASMRTVAAYCSEEAEVKRYATHLNTASRLGTSKGFAVGAAVGAIFFVIMFAYGIGLGFGAYLVVKVGRGRRRGGRETVPRPILPCGAAAAAAAAEPRLEPPVRVQPDGGRLLHGRQRRQCVLRHHHGRLLHRDHRAVLLHRRLRHRCRIPHLRGAGGGGRGGREKRRHPIPCPSLQVIDRVPLIDNLSEDGFTPPSDSVRGRIEFRNVT